MLNNNSKLKHNLKFLKLQDELRLLKEALMAQCEVKMPDLGEGVEKATLSFWHFEEGSKVVKDNDLVEAVTDKATFNIPVPVTGTLAKIISKEGDEVKVSEVIAIIDTE